jgi:hypothetical protein
MHLVHANELIFLGGTKISSTRYIHYGKIDFVLGACDVPQSVLTTFWSCQPLTRLRDVEMGWRRHRGNYHVRCQGGCQPSSRQTKGVRSEAEACRMRSTGSSRGITPWRHKPTSGSSV